MDMRDTQETGSERWIRTLLLIALVAAAAWAVLAAG